MTAYQLVGSQDPTNRLDRWVVESPSEQFPDGKVLEIGGEPVELTDQQYAIGSRFLRLQPAEAEPAPQFVDQPGVEMTSQSTDQPPDPGTTPNLDDLTKDQLVAELGRVRRSDAAALPNVSERTKAEDLREALRNYHGGQA